MFTEGFDTRDLKEAKALPQFSIAQAGTEGKACQRPERHFDPLGLAVTALLSDLVLDAV